jgi:hypothetical protein
LDRFVERSNEKIDNIGVSGLSLPILKKRSQLYLYINLLEALVHGLVNAGCQAHKYIL